MRTLVGANAASHHYHQGQRPNRPAGGNVNVDRVPDNKANDKNKEFRGGEYIDYEEVD